MFLLQLLSQLLVFLLDLLRLSPPPPAEFFRDIVIVPILIVLSVVRMPMLAVENESVQWPWHLGFLTESMEDRLRGLRLAGIQCARLFWYFEGFRARVA